MTKGETLRQRAVDHFSQSYYKYTIDNLRCPKCGKLVERVIEIEGAPHYQHRVGKRPMLNTVYCKIDVWRKK